MHIHPFLGVQLAAAGAPQRWRCLRTPPVILKELLGTWIFAACVIDGNEGTVTHYFNGQPMGNVLDGAPVPVRLGTVGVVNWPDDPKDRNWVDWRKYGGGDHSINLNGRMDELAIFSSALSAKEIRAIYENAPWGKADLAEQKSSPCRILKARAELPIGVKLRNEVFCATSVDLSLYPEISEASPGWFATIPSPSPRPSPSGGGRSVFRVGAIPISRIRNGFSDGNRQICANVLHSERVR